MKLCYIAHADSIHTRRWISPFIEQGDQVYLISYRPVKLPWKGLEDLVDLTQLTNANKIRFVYWGWWIWHYIRNLQPDILHAHQVTTAGWLGVMANYHPFVVSGWGSDILIQPHQSILYRKLVKLVFRRCDKLTVPSLLMHDAARALGMLESRLHLIPWGIETDIFKPTPVDRLETRKHFDIAPDAKVILCPRGIRRVYNIDIILEAIRIIAPQEAGLRLVLPLKGVDQNYLATLKQMISRYGLDKNVLWLPFQETPTDMARLYRMANVVVSIPSSEGYGFTVYEAMATGCPTVISDLPIFKNELISGVHTIKVPVRNVVQTGRAVANILANEDLCQRLQNNAINICQTKSVKDRIGQTDALYRELCMQHVNISTVGDN